MQTTEDLPHTVTLAFQAYLCQNCSSRVYFDQNYFLDWNSRPFHCTSCVCYAIPRREHSELHWMRNAFLHMIFVLKSWEKRNEMSISRRPSYFKIIITYCGEWEHMEDTHDTPNKKKVLVKYTHCWRSVLWSSNSLSTVGNFYAILVFE